MSAWCCAHTHTYTQLKLAAIDTKKTQTNTHAHTHTHKHILHRSLQRLTQKKHKQILKHTHTHIHRSREAVFSPPQARGGHPHQGTVDAVEDHRIRGAQLRIRGMSSFPSSLQSSPTSHQHLRDCFHTSFEHAGCASGDVLERPGETGSQGGLSASPQAAVDSLLSAAVCSPRQHAMGACDLLARFLAWQWPWEMHTGKPCCQHTGATWHFQTPCCQHPGPTWHLQTPCCQHHGQTWHLQTPCCQGLHSQHRV